ncbi:F-box/kelch-repeat protein At3g23880-like [Papaver somniferum]|uniref:F-box/kelch-repeat protein At3g23880-like n=1 Tax=Papaver somniferum TaxID=3469 RepID=UPI000E6FFAEF|nr:F-box/kelch-repeat protein At3g23880-like [Papaver somniferum]
MHDHVGFGYCRSTNTYKLVKIARGSKKGKQHVKVYTLGDRSGWRDKPEITYEVSGSGVFANGAVHWVINKRSPTNCDIVAFDLAEESFRPIPPPPCHPKSFHDVNLGCCEANIYMCHPYTKKKEDKMDIWVFEKKNMNNCGSNSLEESMWIRRFSGKREKSFLTRSLSRTESEILIWQNRVLTCYDPKTSKKIWCIDAQGSVSEAIPHMHSFVSLKDFREERVDHVVVPEIPVYSF